MTGQGVPKSLLDITIGSSLTREPETDSNGYNKNHQRHDYSTTTARWIQRTLLCHGVAGVPGTGTVKGVVTVAGGAVSANSTQLVMLEKG